LVDTTQKTAIFILAVVCTRNPTYRPLTVLRIIFGLEGEITGAWRNLHHELHNF
jgi:hypothetical protein